MKYIVTLHRNVAESFAVEGRKQYVATLEIDAEVMMISDMGNLVFSDHKGYTLYAFAISQWFSVRQKDFNSIKNITPTDSLSIVETTIKEEE